MGVGPILCLHLRFHPLNAKGEIDVDAHVDAHRILLADTDGCSHMLDWILSGCQQVVRAA